MTKKNELKNVFVMDCEVFVNLYTLICRRVDTKEYKKFVIHTQVEEARGEFRNDFKELYEFLEDKPAFIGFNNLAFDGQVIEYIYREKVSDATKIYEFAQEQIERTNADPFDLHYHTNQMLFNHLDLFKLNHYDKRGKDESGEDRQTGLKWLEFSMRCKTLKDMPFEHTKVILPTHVSKVLTYNKNDVDVTYQFWEICRPQIDLRRELAKQYNDRSFMNKSDSSIGSEIFLKALSRHMKISEGDLRKKRTHRKEINVGDCIVDYISFNSPELNKVLTEYKNLNLKAKEGELKLKGAFKFSADFGGLKFDYGTGGLHAFGEPAFYRAGNGYVIIDVDFKSYYPNLAIVNRFFPEHLSDHFCDTYLSIFKERVKHPKKSAMNEALKIVLNGVYGKTNSKYSYLLDPKYMMQITANGQLTLTMLAERVAKVSKLIQCNTDGLTAILKEENVAEFKSICMDFQSLVKIELEFAEYTKMAIRDVNNYVAQMSSGEIKRKGVFEIYEDCVTNHDWHKNFSQEIVALAAQEYYIKGIDVMDTIQGQETIWPFLMAVKKQRNFNHILWTADIDRYVSNEVFDQRTFRYYASTDGGCLYKHYKDERISAIKKEFLVSPALVVKNEKIENYRNIDFSYYEKETYKIINEIGA